MVTRLEAFERAASQPATEVVEPDPLALQRLEQAGTQQPPEIDPLLLQQLEQAELTPQQKAQMVVTDADIPDWVKRLFPAETILDWQKKGDWGAKATITGKDPVDWMMALEPYGISKATYEMQLGSAVKRLNQYRRPEDYPDTALWGLPEYVEQTPAMALAGVATGVPSMTVATLRTPQAKRAQYEADRQFVMRHLTKMAEMAVRKPTLASQITEGVIHLIPYALQMGLTSPIAAPVKTGIKLATKTTMKAAPKALRPAIGLAGRVVGGLAQGAIRGAATAPYVLAQTLGEETGMLTPEGELVAPRKTFGRRFRDNLFNQMLDMAGEVAGGDIMRYGKKLLPPKIATLLSKIDLAKRLAKTAKGKARLDALMKHVGWHGFLEEWTEEDYTNLLQALAGLRGGDTFVERLANAVPSLHELAVRAGVLSVPQAARAGLAVIGTSEEGVSDHAQQERQAAQLHAHVGQPQGPQAAPGTRQEARPGEGGERVPGGRQGPSRPPETRQEEGKRPETPEALNIPEYRVELAKVRARESGREKYLLQNQAGKWYMRATPPKDLTGVVVVRPDGEMVMAAEAFAHGAAGKPVPVAEGAAPPTAAKPAQKQPVQVPAEGTGAEIQEPATPREKAGKQPWEMTQAEFHRASRERMLEKSPDYFSTTTIGIGPPAHKEVIFRAQADRAHQQHVEQALQEGKPVPAEVLKDYPDLAEKYARKAIEAAPTRAEQPVPPATVEATAEEKPRPRPGGKPAKLTEREADNLIERKYRQENPDMPDHVVQTMVGTYRLAYRPVAAAGNWVRFGSLRPRTAQGRIDSEASEKTARNLAWLEKHGLVERAWDRTGETYYAVAGTDLPEWLSQDDSEAALKALPEPPHVRANLTVTKSYHKKKQQDIWVVKIADRVDRTTYEALRDGAEQAGGYYSKFAKGFVFNAEEPAREFVRRHGRKPGQEGAEGGEKGGIESKAEDIQAEQRREVAEQAAGEKGQAKGELAEGDLQAQAEQVHRLVVEKKQAELNAIGQAVAEELGATWKGTPKSVKSIVEKVQRYRRRRPDYNVFSMDDHARGAIILRDWSDAPAAIEKLAAKGAYVTQTLERIREPFGYRGIHLAIDLGDRIKGEIQLHTAESWKIKKDASDAIYRKWRNVRLTEMTPEQQREYDNDAKNVRSRWDTYWANVPPEIISSAASVVRNLEANKSSTMISPSLGGRQESPSQTESTPLSDRTTVLSSASRKYKGSLSIPERIPQEPPVVKHEITGPVLPAAETEIHAVGIDKPIKARYAVMEADDLLPSHDFRSGRPVPNTPRGYPASLQPRAYEPGSDEAHKVVRFALEKKPGYYISTHPGPDNGPPVVDGNGIVINGNGRAMSLQYADNHGGLDWYVGYLKQHAAEYGLRPSDLERFRSPVLVRVVTMRADSDEAARFARAGNITTTQAQAAARTAAALADLLTTDLLAELPLSEDMTLSEALNGSAGAAFRRALRQALPPSQVSLYFAPNDQLTDAGKELVRNMLLAKILPVETIENLQAARKQLVRTLEGAIPQLLLMRRQYPDMDLTAPLAEALAFLGRHPEATTPGQTDMILGQGALFGDEGEKVDQLSPAGRMMIDFLLADGGKPRIFRNKLTRLLRDLSASSGLFAGETPEMADLAAEVLGVKKRQGADFRTGANKTGRPPLTLEGLLEQIRRHLPAVTAEQLDAYRQILQAHAEYLGMTADEWVSRYIAGLTDAAVSETEPGILWQPGVPAFDAWFGGSKVVDGAGKAKVMYHGTARPDFAMFDPQRQDSDALYGPGFYFTDDPVIAGGDYEYYAEWTYHDSRQAAERQPGRVGFVWQVTTEGPLQGKWVAQVRRARLRRPGYIHKITGLDPAQRTAAVNAIYNSDEYRQTMAAGPQAYLSEAERAQVVRFLNEFERTGNYNALLLLAEQPYNIPVVRILEREGVISGGGVIPVYLSIKNPLDMRRPVPKDQAVRFLTDLERAIGTYAREDSLLADRNERREGYLRAVAEAFRDTREELESDYAGQVNVTYDTIYRELQFQLNAARRSELDPTAGEALRGGLETLGYDGIAYEGGRVTGGPRHTVFIAFRPEQIKSVFNQGSYDPATAHLLHQGQRGAVRFTQDGRAIIHAFQRSDFSTLLHETFHVMRRHLPAEDLAVLEDYAGVRNGNWTVEAEEKVAKAWERYLADARMVPSKLRAVFAKLAAWLKAIYRGLKNSPLKIEIPENVEKMFYRILGGETAQAGPSGLTKPSSEDILLEEHVIEREQPYEQRASQGEPEPGRPDRSEPPGGRTVAETPAAPLAGVEEERRTVRGPGGGRPVGRATHPARDRYRAGRGGGEGVRPEGVHLPAGHRRPEVVGSLRRKSQRSNKHDYRITESDSIGVGSDKTRFRNNLQAIRLLKKLEAENRLATPEEQAVLVRYVGWGNLSAVFDSYNRQWQAERQELRELLTDEEYEAAAGSTLNAHYTSPEIIRAIWNVLQQWGFTGGRICEPAAGIGHFFGLMPDEIYSRSHLHGIELDSISARIASQLYQTADIRQGAFEKVRLPDNYFDLFISNVPFGKYRVFDPERPKLNFTIHDFFFAKAIEKTRPGGLVVFITSHYSLDKINPAWRRYMADRADLVTAVRLPKTAFLKNAGTEVVTDILVFQKRQAGAKTESPPWSQVGTLGDLGVRINRYLLAHPDHVLGKHATTGSMYGGREYTVEPNEGVDLGAAVTEVMAADRPPAAIDRIRVETERRNEPQAVAPAPDHLKEYAYTIEGGKLYQNRNGQLTEQPVRKADLKRYRHLLAVRDAARKLIHRQLDPEATDETVEAARRELNRVYDAAVAAIGPLSVPANTRLMQEDPDWPLLLSLEHYDPDTKTAKKAAIFHRRTQRPLSTVSHAETPDDALAASLSERGRVDLDYMAEISGRDKEELVRELEGRIYKNPEGDWEPADEYLSGDVVSKLEIARAAAELDKDFAKNVAVLEKVQPEPVQAADIDVKLGAPWVPEDVYDQFVRDVLGLSNIRIKHVSASGSWVLNVPDWMTRPSGGKAEWSTARVSVIDVFDAAINHKKLVVHDTDAEGNKILNRSETAAARAKVAALRREFARWVWAEPSRRERLEREYNRQLNRITPRKYDGSHLRLPGLTSSITPRPHQKNAIWRILTSGNTLLDHVVGSGKTLIMAASAMEMRRLGIANKPVLVAPNHLIDSHMREVLRFYPHAKVLAPGKKDFSPQRRSVLMNRIATGDWDLIIVPMSSFERIPMSPGVVQEFYERQIDELEDELLAARQDKGNRQTVKQLERAKKQLQALLDRIMAGYKKDAGPYFDELGIDALFVDEAHHYKNLYFRTRMHNVPGIASQLTQRSFDMYMKVSYLNRHSGNKAVVFATGTPISNSITELYTIQRYLQPDVLEQYGLSHFDDWAATFGEIVTQAEAKPTGKGYRMHSRFISFNNIPEMARMYGMVGDTVTQEQVALEIPQLEGGKHEVVTSPRSRAVAAYIDELENRAEKVRRGAVDPQIDNMLNITTDGRKAALDFRLIDPHAADDPDSKVNRCVENVYDIWKQTAKEKSLQVVWLDLSAPGKGFNLYDDIKQKLIKRGVPTDQIAFIHDAKTEKDTGNLFRKAREGQVRVLLASTAKMGEGANIQERLYAAHHLSPPWRPSDIEQRDGRILRHGNSNKKVRILRYVTKGTFDTYMWQTLENKAKFIQQFRTGNAGQRRISDVDDLVLSYAEVKALAAENPKILEVVRLESELNDLRGQDMAHRSAVFVFQQRAAAARREANLLHRKLETLRALQESFGKTGAVEMKLRGTVYRDKKIGKPLVEILDALAKKSAAQSAEPQKEIAQLCGLDATLCAALTITGEHYEIIVGWDRITLSDSASGNVTRLRNFFDNLPARIETTQQKLDEVNRQAADYEKQARKPFDKQAEIESLENKLEQLKQELTLGEITPDRQVESDPDSAPGDGHAGGPEVLYQPGIDDDEVNGLLGLPYRGVTGLLGSAPTGPLDLVQSTDRLALMAPKWGRIAGNSFHVVTDYEKSLVGQWRDMAAQAMKDLRRSDYRNFMEAMRGRRRPANPRVARAVAEVTALLDDIGITLEELKLPVPGGADYETFRRIRRGYWPQYFNTETRKQIQNENGPAYEALIDWIAGDLQAREMEYVNGTLRPQTKKWSLASRKKQARKFLRDRRRYEPAGRELTELYHALASGQVPKAEIGHREKGFQYHRAFEYPLEFLLENPHEAVERHIQQAARRIAEAIVWDQRKEVEDDNGRVRMVRLSNGRLKTWALAGASEAEKTARAQGKDPDEAKLEFLRLFSKLIGYESNVEGLQSDSGRGTKRLLRQARTATSGLQLFGIESPLWNILWGQLTSATRFGLTRTGVNWLATLLHPSRIRAARQAGALEHSGVRHFFAEGVWSEIVNVSRAPMSAAEVINRTSAAFAGLGAWEDAIRRAHRRSKKAGRLIVPGALMRELTHKDVGFRSSEVEAMVRRGTLSTAERRKLMRGAVNITQFSADPKDLPASWFTETGRFWTQFWAMAYKQTQHTLGYILREMGYGNFVPFLRFAIAAVFAGVAKEAIRELLRGRLPRKRDLEKMDRILRLFSDSLGILERPLQVLEATDSGRIVRIFTPAAIGTAADMAWAALNVVKSFAGGATPEKKATALRRLARTTSVGRTVAGQLRRRAQGRPSLFGTAENAPEADDYFRARLRNAYRRNAPAEEIRAILRWGRQQRLDVDREVAVVRQTLRSEYYDLLYEAEQDGDRRRAIEIRKFLYGKLKANYRNVEQALENRRRKQRMRPAG